MERELIRERTLDGLRAAVAAGSRTHRDPEPLRQPAHRSRRRCRHIVRHEPQPRQRAQLHRHAQYVAPGAELTQERLIRTGQREMADQLGPAQLREPPQPCQLLLGEHVPGSHDPTHPSNDRHRTDRNATGSLHETDQWALALFAQALGPGQGPPGGGFEAGPGQEENPVVTKAERRVRPPSSPCCQASEPTWTAPSPGTAGHSGRATRSGASASPLTLSARATGNRFEGESGRPPRRARRRRRRRRRRLARLPGAGRRRRGCPAGPGSPGQRSTAATRT